MFYVFVLVCCCVLQCFVVFVVVLFVGGFVLFVCVVGVDLLGVMFVFGDQVGGLCVFVEVVCVFDGMLYWFCWVNFQGVVLLFEVQCVGVIDFVLVGDLLVLMVVFGDLLLWIVVMCVGLLVLFGIVVQFDLLVCVVVDLKG